MVKSGQLKLQFSKVIKQFKYNSHLRLKSMSIHKQTAVGRVSAWNSNQLPSALTLSLNATMLYLGFSGLLDQTIPINCEAKVDKTGCSPKLYIF